MIRGRVNVLANRIKHFAQFLDNVMSWSQCVNMKITNIAHNECITDILFPGLAHECKSVSACTLAYRHLVLSCPYSVGRRNDRSRQNSRHVQTVSLYNKEVREDILLKCMDFAISAKFQFFTYTTYHIYHISHIYCIIERLALIFRNIVFII
jgi:hypothetical protein